MTRPCRGTFSRKRKNILEEMVILDFLCLVEKYYSVEELTPEIIRSFVDKIIVHEKRKGNGHYRQKVEIGITL